jgi:shikimate dehydrogenase
MRAATPPITGLTEFIAHIGYPTHLFKSPSIYNPYFASAGIDCVLVPMACEADGFPALLRSLFALRNLRGAIITMPHKVSTLGLVDRVLPTAQIAGSCNAVRLTGDGLLEADMFDGVGFVRALAGQGFTVAGARTLVVGSGGVGSAIAASLAVAGAGAVALYDTRSESAESLAGRIRQHCPMVQVLTGSNDPTGFDLVVNATPLGMHAGDPMPLEPARIAAGTFVSDVVLSKEPTAFLQAAAAQGARIQVGADMLFEQIPAYLDFFGLPTTTPAFLRSVAV